MLSKIVPRPAGRTMELVACCCAMAESVEARTVAIQAARTSSAAKETRMQRRSSRMRELTIRASDLFPRKLDVARVCRRGRDIVELDGRLLDPLGGRCVRDLRGERGILRLKFDLLAVEPAYVHVHP